MPIGTRGNREQRPGGEMMIHARMWQRWVGPDVDLAPRAWACAAAVPLLALAYPWLVKPRAYVTAAYAACLLVAMLCQMAAWLFVAAVTGRPVASSLLLVLFTACLVVINNLRYLYTGMVALPIDVLGVAGIIADLDLFGAYVARHLTEAILLALALGGVVLAFATERSLFGGARPRRAVIRLTIAVVAGLLFCPASRPESLIQRAFAQAGARFKGEDPNASVIESGLLPHLIVALPDFSFRIPRDHGDPTLLSSRFAREIAARRQAPVPAELPDVVVILGESFFDPRRLNVTFEPEILSDFDALRAAADYYGSVSVHAVGGGTTRTEFSFLTGIPTTILGQRGQWPFYSLVTRPLESVARALRRLGYRAVAIYPAPGSLFGARSAYRLLGFDEFIALPEVAGREAYAGPYIADAAVAAAIEDVLRGSTQPTFVFALTMESHGPWGAARGWPDKQVAVKGDLDEIDRETLEQYARRLAHVEAMATGVHAALGRRAKPFVLTLFGDHLPAMRELVARVGFRDAPRGGEAADARLFETPYFIASSLTGRRAGQQRNVDISFLASLMLEAATINADAFFGINAVYRDACEGNFARCGVDEAVKRAYVQMLYDRLEQTRPDAQPGPGAEPRLLAAAYRVGDHVRPGSAHFGQGWSAPEPWGVWTAEPEASLIMLVEPGDARDLELTARIRFYPRVAAVDVRANGMRIARWKPPGPGAVVHRTAVIPRAALTDDRLLAVTFEVTNAKSPEPTDTRRLGMALYDLRLCFAGLGCDASPAGTRNPSPRTGR